MEHWAPRLRTMDRCIGQEVRNEAFVMGLPHLQGYVADAVAQDNRIACFVLRRLQMRIKNGGVL
eukprot:4140907-Karenia_brevis.AAC.1